MKVHQCEDGHLFFAKLDNDGRPSAECTRAGCKKERVATLKEKDPARIAFLQRARLREALRRIYVMGPASPGEPHMAEQIAKMREEAMEAIIATSDPDAFDGWDPVADARRIQRRSDREQT